MTDKELSFLGNHETIYKGKAPARLDVMGGIANYSGSMVLQMPLQLYTCVYMTVRSDQKVRIQSESLGVEFDAEPLLPQRGHIVQNELWKKYQLPHWSLYILGCLFVLLDDRSFEFSGVNILVKSDVPQGKGISSSAALEVATLQAMYRVFGIQREKESLAVLAQKAENQVAESPCGIMDQMSVHLGKKNALLPIICQPFDLEIPIRIPEGLHFIGMDTGVKHAVSGETYLKVRTTAFMGWSIILQSLGVSKKEIELQQKSLYSNLPYKGYLSNIIPEEFDENFSNILPQNISGKDFIEKFGATTDPLSNILNEAIYKVHACTKHPIYENHRIQLFKNDLQKGDPDLSLLGTWMSESHEGYKACGLSCPEADFIVEQVQSLANEQNIYGARITGGGSGGTVCIMTEDPEILESIQKEYERNFSHSSSIFMGSGDGAYFL